MKAHQLKWIYLIVLSLIWGSSFILIKKALIGLTPIQIGALRIFIAGVILLAIGFPKIKKIKKHHWKPVTYSAVLGTFFPAFIFSFAIKGIDSSIASILNSLTPFNTLLLGAVFYGVKFKKEQLIGVLIGLIGTTVLILNGAMLNPNQNYWFALLPIIASIGYALNVNIIKKQLHDLDSLAITVGSFLLIMPPALVVLYSTGFFTDFTYTKEGKQALFYIILLALMGTAFAKVIFNKLISISTPVFSSSVTYLIPVVAVIWGSLDGEKLSVIQLLAGAIILFGVYLTNKKK